MDNQYNNSPEPVQQSQTVSSESNTSVPTPSQQPPAVAQSKPKKHRIRSFFFGLLILLLLAAVGAMYYWQHQQVTDLERDKAVLNSRLSSAEAQIEQQKTTAQSLVGVADKAMANQNTSSDLIPSEVSKKTVNSATLSAFYKPSATLTAVWIEYGTNPTNLTKSTDKQTKELGLGLPDTFAEASFNVTQLTSGTPYYYRVAATSDGKTIYSGVAGFTVLK